MKFKLIFLLTCITFTAVAQEYATGLVMDDDAYSKIPVKPNNVSFFDELADVTNASLKQYVPVVRSQGGYGTCTGWSTAYYGRTIVEAKQRGLTNQEDINEIAFHPIFTYLNAASEENKVNCQKGAGMDKAMISLKNDGSPFFRDYEAQFCADNIPPKVKEIAKTNTIQEYRRLITGNEDIPVRLENVKRALYNGNPVIIGFKVEKSLHTAKGVFVPDELGITGFHAMCVVGFDEDKYGGAFEIVNSWGTDWANNGYIWVKYDDFIKYTRYALEIIPKPIEKKVNTMAGELSIQLSNGLDMNVALADSKFQNKVLGYQDVVKKEDTDSKTVGDYKTTASYPAGTKYQIKTSVAQPSYLYVLYSDSNDESGVLFPNPDNPELVSSYFDTENVELVVPGEEYYFRLNSEVTSDYTIVLFSTEELNITEIAEKLDDLEGELIDKLYLLFNDSLIDKENINLAESKMKFSASFTEGTIAMMVLDIKRM